MLLHLNDENFESEVIKSEVPVLVDFYAEWCGPCKMQGPIIEELATELDGQPYKVAKVDVDKATATAERFGIMSIPTLVFFKNGAAVETVHGLHSKESLAEMLKG